jgi:membrane protein DedA with SNARE-associated domain
VHVEAWLATLPPALICVIVALIIGLESMGVPLPGEIALVSAALLAATGAVNPWAVAASAAAGAIVGDSIGYAVGRRGGRALLERLGRRFPKHFGPAHLAKAEAAFVRWGVLAVFLGRFIALLRILAGPLAGALRVPYPKFLAANASGGIVWAFGTTFAVYVAGQAAERWLRGFAWVGLLLAVLAGLVTTAVIKRRASALNRESDELDPVDRP